MSPKAQCELPGASPRKLIGSHPCVTPASQVGAGNHRTWEQEELVISAFPTWSSQELRQSQERSKG